MGGLAHRGLIKKNKKTGNSEKEGEGKNTFSYVLNDFLFLGQAVRSSEER